MESKALREWKRLRMLARTADEFNQLARLCQAQVELYDEKAAASEAELKAYCASPSPRLAPRDLPADQNLKTAIAYCRELSKHWTDLAGEMLRKTVEMQSVEAPR